MQFVVNDTVGIFGNNIFLDLLTSRIGVGIFPNSAKLHLAQEGIEGCQSKMEAFNDGALGPYLTLRRNRGTINFPQPVVTGDRLGEIIFDGRLGIGQAGGGSSIACIVDSIPDTLHLLSRMEFYSGYAKRMTVRSDGPVSIDSGVLKLNSKSTVDRDAMTPEPGMIIYNSDTNKFQGYENGAWVNLV